MNRLKAILLLFALTVSLIPPVTGSSAEANIPACCKRLGKHHCALLAARARQTRSESTEVRVEADQRPCRMFPGGFGPATPTLRAALPVFPEAFGATLTTVSVIAAEAEAQGRIAFSRSRQKRGPPTFLS